MSNNLYFEIVPSCDEQYDSEMIDIISGIFLVEIPIQFITCIEVIFNDGITVHLENEELEKPLPAVANATMSSGFKNVKRVRVYIDLDYLLYTIDEKIDNLFGDKISKEA